MWWSHHVATPSNELLAKGIPSRVAQRVAGISKRQIGYWVETGLVTPSVAAASGKGTARIFSFRDLVALRTIKALLAEGVTLQKVRKAVAELERQWPEKEAPLASHVLVTDGVDLFAVLPEDEARETVLSLVLRPGELAWRRFVVDVGRIAAEVREALDQERAAPKAERKQAAGGGR